MVSASEALKRGDYETAIPELTRLAEQGSAEAQAHLGYLYHVGEGVPQDLTRAAELYRLSAVQGNRDAQYNLAVAYAFGEGVEKDLSEAVTWYRRAAEQDHLISQYSLGISYAYGEGVQQDYSEAARWFSQAADKGYAPAQVHLASLYHTGEGVEQDYIEAARWYRLSAEQGDATAQYNLGLLYRGGKGVDKDTTEARRWLQLAADQGYLAAQNELASLNRAAVAPEISATTRTEPETTEESVTPKEEKSGGFFSRLGALLGGKDDTGTEVEPEIEISAEDEVKETPIEETVEITAAETAPTEAIVEVESLKEPVLPETETAIATGEVPEPVAPPEAPASINVEESVIDNVVLPQEPVAAAPEPEPIQLHEKELADAVAAAQQEESKGFFSRLFGSKGDEASGATPATEQPVEITTAEPAVTDLPVADPVLPESEPAEEVAAVPTEEVIEAAIPRPEELAVEESIVTNVVLPEPEQPELRVQEKPVTEIESPDETTVAAETDVTQEVAEKTAAVEKELVEPAIPRPEQVAVEEAVVTNVLLPKPEQPVEISIAEEQEETVKEEKPETESIKVVDKAEPTGTRAEVIAVEDEIEATIKQADAKITASSVALQADTEISELVTTEEPGQPQTVTTTAPVESIDTSQYSIDEGRRALLDNDHEQALYHFEPLARAGNTEAQSLLGNMYYNGQGVEQDYGESFLWYHLAAEQGNKNAQYLVGNMYLLGEGVKQDNEQAAYWYGKSSAQGHIAAKQNLESLRELQEINKQNESAQDQPVVETATALSESTREMVAVVDRSEEITETEPAEVVKTPDTSETQPEDSKTSGGGFFASLFGSDEPATEVPAVTVEAEVTKPEPKEVPVSTETPIASETANTREVEIEEKSLATETVTPGNKLQELVTLATQGDSNAQYQLATRYYSGKDVKQDYSEAAMWYRRAAEQDNMDAQYSLGNMYLLGEGVQQDNNIAGQWYARAAKQGHASAQNNLDSLKIEIKTEPEPIEMEPLPVAETEIAAQEIEPEPAGPKDDARLLYELGLAHSFGDGVKQDYQAAYNYFLESARKGYAAAQYKTGVAYAYGEGVKQDYAQAAEWYGKAAEQGHMIAQRNLATMYLNGNGIKQDRVKAMAWYQVIANSGNAMDVRRRDMLKKQMSQVELSASQELASQISQRLKNSAPL